jgi:hypothetical protein
MLKTLAWYAHFMFVGMKMIAWSMPCVVDAFIGKQYNRKKKKVPASSG